MVIKVLTLIILGFFIYGFKYDKLQERLEHKKLKDLTTGDLFDIVLGFILILVFLRIIFDLF